METQWFQGCYTLYKQPRVDESATQTDQLSYHVLSSILFTARYPVHWQHFILHKSMFVCFFPCDQMQRSALTFFSPPYTHHHTVFKSFP